MTHKKKSTNVGEDVRAFQLRRSVAADLSAFMGS